MKRRTNTGYWHVLQVISATSMEQFADILQLHISNMCSKDPGSRLWLAGVLNKSHVIRDLGDRRFAFDQKRQQTSNSKYCCPRPSADIFITVESSLTGSSATILVLPVVLEEQLRLPKVTSEYIPRSCPCTDAILPRIGSWL